jgi:hypothetical protein
MGGLVGACLLTAFFFVADRLSVSPAFALAGVLLAATCVAWFLFNEQRRNALQRWRLEFPQSPSTEIRDFLRVFNRTLRLSRFRPCCFSPEQKVLDIWRAVHPARFMSDSSDLEILNSSLREKYGVDSRSLWTEDLTLGELFARVLGVTWSNA